MMLLHGAIAFRHFLELGCAFTSKPDVSGEPADCCLFVHFQFVIEMQPAKFLPIQPTRMLSRPVHGQVQYFTFMYPNKEDNVV